jgi:plasmid stabilization system protein ParE
MIAVITDEAEADLERIGDIIAAANPVRAISFVRELRQCCEELSNMPERFQLVPRHEQNGVRRRVHGSYLIFYRVGVETVDVLHVLYSAMDYEPLLFPEG